MQLTVDFNQGLHLGEAMQRCHMIDDLGLAWIEEPIVYDNLDGYAQLAAELKTRSRPARTSRPRDCTALRQEGVRQSHARLSQSPVSALQGWECSLRPDFRRQLGCGGPNALPAALIHR